MTINENVVDVEFFVVCPICGGKGRISAAPWRMAYIIHDPRGAGVEISIKCASCGHTARPGHACGWPDVTGHVTTEAEALETAIKYFTAQEMTPK